jgi:hypothetical protein
VDSTYPEPGDANGITPNEKEGTRPSPTKNNEVLTTELVERSTNLALTSCHMYTK